MDVIEGASRIYRFGSFEVDAGSGELRKQGIKVKLQEQPFRLLIALLERAGEVVTREELQQQLWSGNTFVEFDASLRVAVRKLREALGDEADSPRYLETIPRRGYRFVGPVSQAEKIPGMMQASRRQPRKWLSRGTAAVLVLLGIAAGLGFFLLRDRWRSGPKTGPIRSLAVLPLKNLSGDPEQEYFADGMTEELIDRLSDIKDLRVISRSSAMRFKDTAQPAPEIAGALHVDAIVEGSVLRQGGRVQVAIQLIGGATNERIWAEQYQGEDRNVLVLQEEIAQNIARKVQLGLAPQEQAARAVDPQAHENYLKGRYYFNQRSEGALRKSIGYFQEALNREPSYALAYSGLADAYTLLGYRGHLVSADALLKAKQAARKALELDDTLAEAHASLAFLAETHEWDWATAEREYRRALELNPGYALAHDWYAGYLMYVGRFDEGIAEARRARDLDPLSLPINNALAGRLLVAGHFAEAMAQLRETLEMDPHFAPAHNRLGWAYLAQGQREQAIHEFQEAVDLSGSLDPDLLLDLGFGYAVVGQRRQAITILEELKKEHEKEQAPSGAIGILYGALGERDQAFAWLETAYQEHDPELTYIKVGPRFDPLRHDERFQLLVRRIGLPQ